jgi:uncharacterized protein (UPF0332 family)
MTWTDIEKNNLEAAQKALQEYPRTCASRAYYAAHVVLADALVAAGCAIGLRRQTPPHQQQAKLIGQYLGNLGVKRVRHLRSAIRRLYTHRLEADYMRTVALDSSVALGSLRDACEVFKLLNIEY